MSSHVSPRKKVYIHVGLPKTGTTTFQKALAANKEKLRGYELDVIVDRDDLEALRHAAERVVRNGTKDVMGYLKLQRATRQLAASIRRSNHSTVLISHENILGWRIKNIYKMSFANGPAVVVRAIEKALSDCDVFWIMGTRETEAHMRSSYKFYMKIKGVTKPYEDWSQEIGSAASFDKLVADARAFWGDRGFFFSMEEEIARGGFWGGNILRHVGMSGDQVDALDGVEVANSSVPEVLKPFAARLNTLGLSHSLRKQMYNMLVEVRQVALIEAQAAKDAK